MAGEPGAGQGGDADAVALARAMPRELYLSLRRALELGRWESGEPLTTRQREDAMAALLVWEDAHPDSFAEGAGNSDGARDAAQGAADTPGGP